MAGRLLARGRGRYLGGPGADQAGVSTVELVILLPLVVFLTFLPVQAALIWHARQVLIAAAQEGARAARAADLTDEQAQNVGTQQAQQFAGSVGGRAVAGTSVVVCRAGEQVRVQVTGQALAILPAFSITVHGQAVSPVEHFVAAP